MGIDWLLWGVAGVEGRGGGGRGDGRRGGRGGHDRGRSRAGHVMTQHGRLHVGHGVQGRQRGVTAWNILVLSVIMTVQ